MLKNFKLYARSAFRHSNIVGGINFLTLLAMILFYRVFACRGAWYFIAIIVAADTLRFLARGAWYRAPFHETAHWHNPSKDLNSAFCASVRIVMLGVLAITKLMMTLMNEYLGHITKAVLFEHIRAWTWYFIAIATIIESFRCLLHTMHKHNKDWLIGARGHIGIPNWISIVRMAISVIMPHIYIYQSFGEHSNLIATGFLIVAIGTDAIDGFIARTTTCVTKVGKYLDPLSDKIIFAPNAIAFVWLLWRNSKDAGSYYLITLTCIFMLVAFARDILFFVWFFTKGRKIPSGIGASLVDKVRMGGICVWLLMAALALSIPSSKIQSITAIISIVMIATVALLSIISIKIDYERLEKALKQT